MTSLSFTPFTSLITIYVLQYTTAILFCSGFSSQWVLDCMPYKTVQLVDSSDDFLAFSPPFMATKYYFLCKQIMATILCTWQTDRHM